MDIQKIISDLLGQINGNKDLTNQFKADPAKLVTSLLKGIDLNNDQLKAIIDGISAKLKLDDAKNVLNTLGGLFGKK